MRGRVLKERIGKRGIKQKSWGLSINFR
ncbi:hypothetical protein BDE36_0820 [Arcticibacter tournemirensis]|nr:hypothetical protein BDE36_0820 [Arcticibacter tournemirensis]